MDRERGSACWGQGPVGSVVGSGCGEHARGEAGRAGGLEDEGGEVEVAVWDGDGVEGWDGVWGQIVELYTGVGVSRSGLLLRRERNVLTVASSGTVARSAMGVAKPRVTVAKRRSMLFITARKE